MGYAFRRTRDIGLYGIFPVYSEKITIPDGTAHYLEHKLFESEEKGAFELFAKTGANCNAGTSYDHTVYYFTCTDHFEENLEILLNFVQSPYFTPETVEKERLSFPRFSCDYKNPRCFQTLFQTKRCNTDIPPEPPDAA